MQYCVYIMTNKNRTVLYTGVTSNLRRRVWQHRNTGDSRSFTHRYNVRHLVYLETTGNVRDAISREKQIKAGSRRRKIALIESVNPLWRDLMPE